MRNYTEKSKNCACVACYEDNEISIKKLINSRLNGFNGLTPYNINLIIDHTNLDRSKLNNELDKINDEAFLGNKINTNKLLAQTGMDNEKNIFYLNIINQRLEKLLQINNLNKSTIEDAINSLKPPVFWKDKPNLTNQAKKWNKFKVQKMINLTFKLEKKIKSNNLIEKNILIKKLLVDICSLANA